MMLQLCGARSPAQASRSPDTTILLDPPDPCGLTGLAQTSWAEVPLALQIQNLEGRTVLLRLTLKRRKLPHPSFDPMSELPI